ncbi:hypothetical protein F5Y10DRAFT_173679 [Nemania abortiva]|nr:hypothetical protein F5Y10DRAFT_173679 [Nemania abortiva]
MDISSLQVPKAGRSRFSKALPTPPPGLDDRPQTALRDLPDVPPAPLPPKKNSILITRPSTTSLRSKALDSPLPVLPIMAEAPRPRAQAGPIARKPVALLPTPPTTTEANTKSKAMKRKSSISSLLSAYSRSSSDWAQMSSQESDYTKDSEPSYSPEQEVMKSLPPVPSKKSMETTNDSNSDRTSEVTSYTIIDSFPPPPPLKDPSRPRPRTPSAERPGDKVQGGQGDSASLSPISLRSGSPRAGREIWRRRASSKSDASLVIAELKLPSSNGSTASTSVTPAGKAEPPSLLPPLPTKTKQQPALPPPSKQQQPATTFPPRTTSVPVTLPGRNIRPIKPAVPVDEDGEMKKLLKLSKLKELVRRGDSDDDSDDGGERKRPDKKDEQHELQDIQNPPNVKSNVEADKPELPAKDNVMQNKQQLQQQQNASRAAAGETSMSPASPPGVPAPPPNESGKAAGTAISRRPVGAVPTRNISQPEPQLGLDKKNTTAPNLQPSSALPAGTSQPRNPVGTLPHPRQRQQQPQRAAPAYPYPRSGPTSPTGGLPRSVSAFSQPSSSAAPAVPMAGLPRAPGAINTNIPNYPQPQASKPTSPGTPHVSPERGSLSPRHIAPQQTSPTVPHSPPFLTQPSAPKKEREELAADQPMSAAAAAAVALFPRKQDWKVECTVDGVLAPKPLSSQHYNCFKGHTNLMNSRNTNYPLACQTCGIADRERRCMCNHCNLRICLPCADVLVANGRDLQVTMKILREQGRIKNWSDYPKRTDAQNA